MATPLANGNGKARVSGAPPEPVKKKMGNAPTKGYHPQGAWWGWGTQVLDGKPIFTWYDVPRMFTDPQVIFISQLWRAPFQKVQFTVKANNDKVARFVQNTIKRFWRESLPKILSRYFRYGFGPGGAEFVTKNGWWRLDQVRAVECRDANPQIYADGERKGQFAGFDLQNSMTGAGETRFVAPPHAFWFAGHQEYSQFYDRAPLAGLFEPWLRKNGRGGALHNVAIWYQKNAAQGMELRYPPGQSNMGSDENPMVMDNQDIARQIVDTHETNSTMLLTNERMPGSEEYEWQVKYPEGHGDIAGFLEYPEKLDEAMVKGAGIPLEVIQGSDSGSGYKGRLVSYGGFLGTVDELTGLILKDCQAWLHPLVAVNYGPDAWYEIEPVSLSQIASEEEKRQPTNPVGQPLASLPGDGGSNPGNPGKPAGPAGGNASGGGDLPFQLSTTIAEIVPNVPVPQNSDNAVLEAIKALGAAILAVVKPASVPEAKKKYGCVLVPLPGVLADQIRAIGQRIPDSALADDGREDEPHITCRFGLETCRAEDLSPVLKKTGPLHIKLGKVSVFPRPQGNDYDVLKVEVDSPDLHKLDAALGALPNHRSFPSYNPHVTIACVKAGLGEAIAAMIPPLGGEFDATDVTYSDPAKHKTAFALGTEMSVVLGPDGNPLAGTVPPPKKRGGGHKAGWSPYKGPHGGQGWVSATGEIRYQKDMPTDAGEGGPEGAFDHPHNRNPDEEMNVGDEGFKSSALHGEIKKRAKALGANPSDLHKHAAGHVDRAAHKIATTENGEGGELSREQHVRHGYEHAALNHQYKKYKEIDRGIAHLVKKVEGFKKAGEYDTQTNQEILKGLKDPDGFYFGNARDEHVYKDAETSDAISDVHDSLGELESLALDGAPDWVGDVSDMDDYSDAAADSNYDLNPETEVEEGEAERLQDEMEGRQKELESLTEDVESHSDLPEKIKEWRDERATAVDTVDEKATAALEREDLTEADRARLSKLREQMGTFRKRLGGGATEMAATVGPQDDDPNVKRGALDQSKERLMRTRKSTIATLLALAMVRKQQEASAAGKPEMAAGSLQKLSKLASDPIQVARIIGMKIPGHEMSVYELAWTAFSTKPSARKPSGGIGAISDTLKDALGRPKKLYGKQAEDALRAHDNRTEKEAGAGTAHEALHKVYRGEAHEADIIDLGNSIGHLSLKELNEYRVKLEAKYGLGIGKKSERSKEKRLQALLAFADSKAVAAPKKEGKEEPVANAKGAEAPATEKAAPPEQAPAPPPEQKATTAEQVAEREVEKPASEAKEEDPYTAKLRERYTRLLGGAKAELVRAFPEATRTGVRPTYGQGYDDRLKVVKDYEDRLAALNPPAEPEPTPEPAPVLAPVEKPVAVKGKAKPDPLGKGKFSAKQLEQQARTKADLAYERLQSAVEGGRVPPDELAKMRAHALDVARALPEKDRAPAINSVNELFPEPETNAAPVDVEGATTDLNARAIEAVDKTKAAKKALADLVKARSGPTKLAAAQKAVDDAEAEEKKLATEQKAVATGKGIPKSAKPPLLSASDQAWVDKLKAKVKPLLAKNAVEKPATKSVPVMGSLEHDELADKNYLKALAGGEATPLQRAIATAAHNVPGDKSALAPTQRRLATVERLAAAWRDQLRGNRPEVADEVLKVLKKFGGVLQGAPPGRPVPGGYDSSKYGDERGEGIADLSNGTPVIVTRQPIIFQTKGHHHLALKGEVVRARVGGNGKPVGGQS